MSKYNESPLGIIIAGTLAKINELHLKYPAHKNDGLEKKHADYMVNAVEKILIKLHTGVFPKFDDQNKKPGLVGIIKDLYRLNNLRDHFITRKWVLFQDVEKILPALIKEAVKQTPKGERLNDTVIKLLRKNKAELLKNAAKIPGTNLDELFAEFETTIYHLAISGVKPQNVAYTLAYQLAITGDNTLPIYHPMVFELVASFAGFIERAPQDLADLVPFFNPASLEADLHNGVAGSIIGGLFGVTFLLENIKNEDSTPSFTYNFRNFFKKVERAQEFSGSTLYNNHVGFISHWFESEKARSDVLQQLVDREVDSAVRLVTEHRQAIKKTTDYAQYQGQALISALQFDLNTLDELMAKNALLRSIFKYRTDYSVATLLVHDNSLRAIEDVYGGQKKLDISYLDERFPESLVGYSNKTGNIEIIPIRSVLVSALNAGLVDLRELNSEAEAKRSQLMALLNGAIAANALDEQAQRAQQERDKLIPQLEEANADVESVNNLVLANPEHVRELFNTTERKLKTLQEHHAELEGRAQLISLDQESKKSALEELKAARRIKSSLLEEIREKDDKLLDDLMVIIEKTNLPYKRAEIKQKLLNHEDPLRSFSRLVQELMVGLAEKQEYFIGLKSTQYYENLKIILNQVKELIFRNKEDFKIPFAAIDKLPGLAGLGLANSLSGFNLLLNLIGLDKERDWNNYRSRQDELFRFKPNKNEFFSVSSSLLEHIKHAEVLNEEHVIASQKSNEFLGEFDASVLQLREIKLELQSNIEQKIAIQTELMNSSILDEMQASIDTLQQQLDNNHLERTSLAQESQKLQSTITVLKPIIELLDLTNTSEEKRVKLEERALMEQPELQVNPEALHTQAQDVLNKQSGQHLNFVQKTQDLYTRISSMKAYGNRLKRENAACGQITIDLADTLRNDVDRFIVTHENTPPSAEAYTKFKNEFSARLHSEDRLMSQHRHRWRPIMANIVIGLISIGIALGIKLLHSQITTKQYSFFFNKTARQEHLSAIEMSANTIA